MDRTEFLQKLAILKEQENECMKEASKITEEMNNTKDFYVRETFEKSGYKLNQKITLKDGRAAFVGGAHLSICDKRVVLTLYKPKKDGTMSKLRDWTCLAPVIG